MEQKANRNARPLVCLLSTHPLLLDEYRRQLSRARFSVKSFRLRQVVFEDVSRLAIPSANLYIVDGHESIAPLLVGSLVNRYPNSPVIVVSEKITDSTAFPFLELGVKGLLDYSEASVHLPEAVKVVAGGTFWVERRLLSRFMDSIVHRFRRRSAKAGSPRLSPREREVLECLLENRSNKEIARKLNISERTVKFHVSNLLAKFSVKRRVDLLMLQLHVHRS